MIRYSKIQECLNFQGTGAIAKKKFIIKNVRELNKPYYRRKYGKNVMRILRNVNLILRRAIQFLSEKKLAEILQYNTSKNNSERASLLLSSTLKKENAKINCINE